MSETAWNNVTREITKKNGGIALLLCLLELAVSIIGFIVGIMITTNATNPSFVFIRQRSAFTALGIILIILFSLTFCAFFVLIAGFKVLQPKEALVLTLFGKYYGTILQDGFYFVNPFCVSVNPSTKLTATQTDAATMVRVGSKKISLKIITMTNERQKVNDALGNPIIIGAVVIWRVVDPTTAVFQVDNYKTFLSIQCDSTIRNVARLYPYDTMEDDIDEKTLRGSSQEIALRMKEELQERVDEAGIEVLEVRITHLSYAEEIAAAMLQRQQAVAIIAARQKIVEGAVSMVEMAINKLNDNEIVHLDEERKAAMVSNLLVVLCGNKDAQPIVNSGSIY